MSNNKNTHLYIFIHMKSKNRLNYTISPDVEKLLREYADVSGLKMSKIVEMALTQYIKNEKNKIRNL